MEPHDPQCQRRGIGLYREAKPCFGKSRPPVQGQHCAEQRLLGRPTWYQWPRLRRRHCGVPFRFGRLDGERQTEMGLADSHHTLHPTQLGQELHGLHQLLPGLHSRLRQVPGRQHDLGHC